MARKRFNRRAICSSDNYELTHRAHLDYLKECHNSFAGIYFSEIQKSSTEDSSTEKFTPKYKTIHIFGKPMTVTIEKYNKFFKGWK